jgi:hypothetical protein
MKHKICSRHMLPLRQSTGKKQLIVKWIPLSLTEHVYSNEDANGYSNESVDPMLLLKSTRFG